PGAEARFPEFFVQLVHEGQVWLEWTITMIGLPKGTLGAAPGHLRRAFLRDKRFVPGLRLSRVEGEAATLTRVAGRAVGWLPRTAACAYASPDPTRLAVRAPLGHRLGLHPSTVRWDGTLGATTHDPVSRHPLRVEVEGDRVRVADAGPPGKDLGLVSAWWRSW